MNQQRHCDLCDLPAGREPFTRAFDGVERAFCCAGCLNVYTILSESGLTAAGVDLRQTELFRESLQLGLISTRDSGERTLPPDAETREALYHLSGLWCSSCGWLIEHALSREYGVVSAEVLFTSDLLKVKYCPQYLEPERIPNRVEALGYRIAEYTGDREADRTEWRDLLLRLGIAGGLWMNVMLFSLVIYASYFESIAEGARKSVPLILMALATPAVFYSGWPILRLGFLGLVRGVIRMEALISTGVLAAYGYSVVQAFLGGQHYYFDTACAIVTLVLAGKALERSAKEKTARSISLLYRLMPKKARLLHDGRERFVAVDALEPGMTLLVKPGERIPADGIVFHGNSPVDESVVTGESEPRSKIPGDEVIGGSCNGAGVLEIRVTRAGEEGTLAQIIRSVESAVAGRTPLERSVDRAARIFVPVVLLIAVATLVGCRIVGLPFTEAMLRAIAVLVIACPCALGIATPLATTAAVGASSSRGILIRDARVLETFEAVDLVILDKTGTATEGEFRVRHAAIQPEALALLAGLESTSTHPLARALVRYAGENGVDYATPRDVVIRQGHGMTGTVLSRRVVAGNRPLMDLEEVILPPDVVAQSKVWELEGLTVVFCAVDGVAAGAVAFGDRLRAGAASFVDDLRRQRIGTMLLSGDSLETTARVAAQLAVDDFRGAVTPAGKAEVVRRMRAAGRVVAMAGDGINDAPALAAADLGIAMGSGTDLAMQAAPVVLMGDSLARIGETFEIARSTRKVVRQNLFWAFFYNSLGIGLAIAGILNPILAAGAMVISSLSVIGNTLRLDRRVRKLSPGGPAVQRIEPYPGVATRL